MALRIYQVTKRKVQSVIVEGGALTLNLFIKSGMWDEARVFRSQRSFGQGIEAPALKGNLISEESVFNDMLMIYHHGKNKHR